MGIIGNSRAKLTLVRLRQDCPGYGRRTADLASPLTNLARRTRYSHHVLPSGSAKGPSCGLHPAGTRVTITTTSSAAVTEASQSALSGAVLVRAGACSHLDTSRQRPNMGRSPDSENKGEGICQHCAGRRDLIQAGKTPCSYPPTQLRYRICGTLCLATNASRSACRPHRPRTSTTGGVRDHFRRLVPRLLRRTSRRSASKALDWNPRRQISWVLARATFFGSG